MNEVKTRTERRTFRPSVDVVELEDRLELWADLPGVPKEGLDIQVEKGVLVLRGAVGGSAGDPNRHALYAEYERGDYERSFNLSDDLDVTGISAELAQGTLRLSIPKAAKARPRKIEVQVR